MTTRIVAIGGTVNPGSTTEQALRLAAAAAGVGGAEVQVFGGAYLAKLPHYGSAEHQKGNGSELVEAVRAADGLLIAAPGYHVTPTRGVAAECDWVCTARFRRFS